MIDVGTNRVSDPAEAARLFAKFPERLARFHEKGSALVGDVHPDAEQVAGAITRVPGGVGPLTIAMLMSNTVKAARLRRGGASSFGRKSRRRFGRKTLMLRVGLTGGIGCGKSTVAAMMRELGCRVLDADLLARELIEPSELAFEEIVSTFGPEVVAADGRIDRPRLARIVFCRSVQTGKAQSNCSPARRRASGRMAPRAPRKPIPMPWR